MSLVADHSCHAPTPSPLAIRRWRAIMGIRPRRPTQGVERHKWANPLGRSPRLKAQHKRSLGKICYNPKPRLMHCWVNLVRLLRVFFPDGEDGVDADRISSPVLSPIASLKPPSMAPGVGGFNIDLPAPRASLAEKQSRHRVRATPCVAKADLCPAATDPSLPDGNSCRERRIVLCAQSIGNHRHRRRHCVGVSDEARKQVEPHPRISDAVVQIFNSETSAHQARLVVENQKGFANEPLPLGISSKMLLA